MNRVVIVGCSGSGKTHLANQMSARLSLPVVHLDAIFYDPAWQPMPAEQFAAAQRVLAADGRWIIDGNYAGTLAIRLARADTVIFLDLSVWSCLWGITRRRWRYRGGQHADGVYDRITWSSLTYVLGYRRRMRPRVTRLVDAYADRVRYIRLTSRRHVQQFLHGLHLHQFRDNNTEKSR